MTKVTVEVEEGTHKWAITMELQGKEVALEYRNPYTSTLYWRRERPLGDTWRGKSGASDTLPVTGVWRLYVPPPKPIVVQFGTFAWAVLMTLENKYVFSKEENFTTNNTEALVAHRNKSSSDWEIYNR